MTRLARWRKIPFNEGMMNQAARSDSGHKTALTEKRLFIGVKIQAGEQKDLQAVCKKLKQIADKSRYDIKWAPLDKWHITLKFLGNVKIEEINQLKQALSTLALNEFEFKVRASDVSGFPEPRAARVIYAGVSRTQKLLDLQSEIDALASSLGFASEEREYRPHMTLGRLRSPASITDLVSPFVRKKFHDFKISELTLFESALQGSFPVYIPLHTVTLSAQPEDLQAVGV